MMLKNVISLVLVCAFATAVTQALQKRQTKGRNPISSTPPKPGNILNQNIVTKAIQGLAIDISASEWDLGNKGNMLQSPISIGSLLNLLLLGTGTETHSELKKALRYPYPVPGNIIHEKYLEMIVTSLRNQVKGVNISMDSRLFLQNKVTFRDSFVKEAHNFYGSKAENLDFAGNPSGSTDHINKWVSKTTHGKITKIFHNPLPSSTTFVAANTIYFHGGWEEAFSKKLTHNGLFMTGLKNITIPMMSNQIICNYLDVLELGFDMISLPYHGRNHAMYILTPRGDPDITTLNTIESLLDFDGLNSLIKEMKPVKVSISIPRMRLSHKIDLKEKLQKLGVNKIFNPELADFSKLTSIGGVFVDSILHEAVLDVTETGTVAAAVTSTTGTKTIGPRFVFDRPSLLFIRDNRNGATLFWARVVEPEPIFLSA